MSESRSGVIAIVTVVGLMFFAQPVFAATGGTVSGVVVLAGNPLATGKVTFYRENGQFVGSKIKNGKFILDNVSSGKFQVVVEGKDVPQKYTSEEFTPLTIMIKDGANSFAIELN